MFATKAIIVYWVVATVLAVTTFVLGGAAGYHADDITGAPDGSVVPNEVLLGSPLLTAGVTLLAGVWAVTATVLGAVQTHRRERAGGKGRQIPQDKNRT